MTTISCVVHGNDHMVFASTVTGIVFELVCVSVCQLDLVLVMFSVPPPHLELLRDSIPQPVPSFFGDSRCAGDANVWIRISQELLPVLLPVGEGGGYYAKEVGRGYPVRPTKAQG